MMLLNLLTEAKFNKRKPYRKLLFDSHNMRLLIFNFEPGQEMPVHFHKTDADVALLILEGEGVLTGGDKEIPAKAGTLQIIPLTQPHGLKAKTRLRLLMCIAHAP